jgi:pimeloyl-ACP methyl ester carboxylesterase
VDCRVKPGNDDGKDRTMPQVTLRDGAALAYDVFDFTDPWTTPEPVVLVHGFSKNRKFYYEWIPALARHYRVYNVDLRGHGESTPVPAGFKFDLKVFARDLVDMLDALKIERAHFVMAEFASAVAIELATDFPERVKSMTCPGFGYNWRAAPAGPRAWVEMLKKDGSAVWAKETNKYRLPADADPALRAWYLAEQAKMPASFLISLFEHSAELDQTERLPKITAPTLVMTGSLAQQDTADSVRRGVAMMPRGKLIIFENMPFNVMTAAPAQSIKATLEFLNGVSG